MEILCSVPQCELVNVEHRGATKIRSLARLCNAYKMELVACVTGFQVIQDKCSGNSECSKGLGYQDRLIVISAFQTHTKIRPVFENCRTQFTPILISLGKSLSRSHVDQR